LGRALITVSAGFSGSHLVKALLDQGYHVTVINNPSTAVPDISKIRPVSGRGSQWTLYGTMRGIITSYGGKDVAGATL
jgi:nucleoside-diphosphate-sugar epimerase